MEKCTTLNVTPSSFVWPTVQNTKIISVQLFKSLHIWEAWKRECLTFLLETVYHQNSQYFSFSVAPLRLVIHSNSHKCKCNVESLVSPCFLEFWALKAVVSCFPQSTISKFDFCITLHRSSGLWLVSFSVSQKFWSKLQFLNHVREPRGPLSFTVPVFTHCVWRDFSNIAF